MSSTVPLTEIARLMLNGTLIDASSISISSTLPSTGIARLILSGTLIDASSISISLTLSLAGIARVTLSDTLVASNEWRVIRIVFVLGNFIFAALVCRVLVNRWPKL